MTQFQEVTQYHRTVAPLISQLQEAAVDYEAFERPLPLCDLARCRATCCHDGVVLSPEEAELIVDGVETLEDGSVKTQTVPAAAHELAEKFPKHFAKTRCVFLDDQHRCFWQLKSVNEGKHPWFYKPVSCWMHPVLVKIVNGRPLLTVVSADADSKKFASCTPCGTLGEGGTPARETLKAELEMLTLISGRDFLRELDAPSV